MVDWNLIGIIAVFIIYFGIMIYIGFFYMKKNKTVGDFILGGRGAQVGYSSLGRSI